MVFVYYPTKPIWITITFAQQNVNSKQRNIVNSYLDLMFQHLHNRRKSV